VSSPPENASTIFPPARGFRAAGFGVRCGFGTSTGWLARRADGFFFVPARGLRTLAAVFFDFTA
jgi:hypothetical protein